jgi:hypothetical protein
MKKVIYNIICLVVLSVCANADIGNNATIRTKTTPNGQGYYLTIINRSDNIMMLEVLGARCWYLSDFDPSRGIDAVTIKPGEAKKYYTEAKNSGDCFLGHGWIKLRRFGSYKGFRIDSWPTAPDTLKRVEGSYDPETGGIDWNDGSTLLEKIDSDKPFTINWKNNEFSVKK